MKRLDRIDFLIVIVVISLLWIMIVPRYIKDQTAHKKETCLTNMRKIVWAKQKWEKIGPSDYFEVGKGYYIHSKVTKVWDVPL